MLFCPECGAIMKPTEIDGKKVMKCSCGYSNEKTEDIKFSESIKKDKDVEVVDNDQDYKSLPITEAVCPKCKNKECYYWLMQTRAADEPETKFLRCTKCRYTFRQND